MFDPVLENTIDCTGNITLTARFDFMAQDKQQKTNSIISRNTLTGWFMLYTVNRFHKTSTTDHLKKKTLKFFGAFYTIFELGSSKFTLFSK